MNQQGAEALGSKRRQCHLRETTLEEFEKRGGRDGAGACVLAVWRDYEIHEKREDSAWADGICVRLAHKFGGRLPGGQAFLLPALRQAGVFSGQQKRDATRIELAWGQT